MPLPTLNPSNSQSSDTGYSYNFPVPTMPSSIELEKEQLKELGEIKDILKQSLDIQLLAEQANKTAERLKVEASREKSIETKQKEEKSKGLFSGSLSKSDGDGIISSMFGNSKLGKFLAGAGKLTGAALLGGALLGIGVDAVIGYMEAEEGNEIRDALIKAFAGDKEGGWQNAIRKSVEWASVGAALGLMTGSPSVLIGGALLGAAIGGVAGYLGSDKVKEIVTKAGDYFTNGWDTTSMFTVGTATAAGAALGALGGPPGIVAGALLGTALGMIADYLSKEDKKEGDVSILGSINWVSILTGLGVAGITVVAGASLPVTIGLAALALGISAVWNYFLKITGADTAADELWNEYVPKIKNWFSDKYDSFLTYSKEKIDETEQLWNEYIPKIKDWFIDKYDSFLTYSKEKIDETEQLWNEYVPKIKNWFSDKIDLFINFSKDPVNNTINLWEEYSPKAKKWFTDMFDSILNYSEVKIDSSVDFMSDLVNDIQNSFKRVLYETLVKPLPERFVPDWVDEYFKDLKEINPVKDTNSATPKQQHFLFQKDAEEYIPVRPNDNSSKLNNISLLETDKKIYDLVDSNIGGQVAVAANYNTNAPNNSRQVVNNDNRTIIYASTKSYDDALNFVV